MARAYQCDICGDLIREVELSKTVFSELVLSHKRGASTVNIKVHVQKGSKYDSADCHKTNLEMCVNCFKSVIDALSKSHINLFKRQNG